MKSQYRVIVVGGAGSGFHTLDANPNIVSLPALTINLLSAIEEGVHMHS